MTDLYYTAPTSEQFEELKEEAIRIWNTYDDTHGYATSKINSIKDLENVSDNFMYMVAMFDSHNQVKLSLNLSSKTREAVALRMADGGSPYIFNPFLFEGGLK